MPGTDLEFGGLLRIAPKPPSLGDRGSFEKQEQGLIELR